MDMPCTCPECGDVVELNDMCNTAGKLCYHNMVCQDCFDTLESDGDDSECEGCGNLLAEETELGFLCEDCYRYEKGLDDE